MQHATPQRHERRDDGGVEPAARGAAAVAGTAERLLALQRSAGNAAVARLVASRRTLSRREYPNGTKLTSDKDWTVEDRVKNTERWKKANEVNLQAEASSEYTQIAQRRDFYRWFYIESVKRGCETRWALAASIVAAGANEMANLRSEYWEYEDIAALAGATSDEVQGMMRRGNQVIFDNVLPKLKKLWNSPLKGKAAMEWDAQALAEEQNLIQPMYKEASPEAIKIIEKVAKGGMGSVGEWWSDAAVVKAGDKIKPGKVPYFSGDLTKIEDRWRYGMKLAETFSEITPTEAASPVPVPSTPPAVGTGYLAGSELAKIDVRKNVHYYEAIVDKPMGAAERKAAKARLKLFTPDEQRIFLNEPRFAKWVRLPPDEAADAMSGRTYDLAMQLEYLGNSGNSWGMFDYRDLKPMIKAAPPAKKRAISGKKWQKVFEIVCDDKTIVEAVDDLELLEPERSQWIASERSWL